MVPKLKPNGNQKSNLESKPNGNQKTNLESTLNDNLATLAQTSKMANNEDVNKSCQKGQNFSNVCNNCQETIKGGQLKLHLKSCKIYFKFMTKLPTGYKCKLCSVSALDKGMNSKARIRMNQHLKKFHGDKIYSDQKNTCGLENVKKGKKSKFEKNEGVLKENDKDPNTELTKTVRKNCESCQKSINLRKYFKHSKICNLLEPFSDGYKCSICNFSRSKRREVFNHIREKHKNNIKQNDATKKLDLDSAAAQPNQSENVKIFKCEPCNFKAKYIWNLTQHYKTLKHLKLVNTDHEIKALTEKDSNELEKTNQDHGNDKINSRQIFEKTESVMNKENMKNLKGNNLEIEKNCPKKYFNPDVSLKENSTVLKKLKKNAAHEVKCDSCNEMINARMSNKHFGICKLYIKFIKKSSNEYSCNLCSFKNSARGQAYVHIRRKHENELKKMHQKIPTTDGKILEKSNHNKIKDIPMVKVA